MSNILESARDIGQEFYTKAETDTGLGLKADTDYVDNKPTGFKNYIINGGFDIWQRGTSFTATDSTGFSADRWAWEGFSGTDGQIDKIEYSNFNSIKAEQTSSESVFELNQKIEGIQKFSGKTVTLSLMARTNIVGRTLGFWVAGSGGTGGFSATNYSTTTTEIGTDWTKYTLTVNIPDLTSLVVNPIDSYLKVRIRQYDIGWLEIANIQLEEGSVATPFEQRPYGLELSLCQRYYWQIDSNKTFRKRTTNYSASTASVYINIQHPVNMRTVPTITSPLVDINDATPIAPTSVYSIDNTEAVYLIQNVPSEQYVDIRDGKFDAEL